MLRLRPQIPRPTQCSACREDQTCDNGKCVDVPDMCPCPIESYCDLGTNTCKVGCFDDEGCSTGRICEGDRCQDGCRVDDACGVGQICEELQCRTGCREHEACGTGEICDGQTLSCREGCLYHSDCPLAQICGEGQVCVPGCTADEFLPHGHDLRRGRALSCGMPHGWGLRCKRDLRSRNIHLCLVCQFRLLQERLRLQRLARWEQVRPHDAQV